MNTEPPGVHPGSGARVHDDASEQEPAPLPEDLAHGLDRAGFYARHARPGPRRRATQLLARIEAQRAELPDPSRERVGDELRDLRALLSEGAREHQRRLGRQALLMLAASLLALPGLLLFARLMQRQWDPEDLPSRLVLGGDGARTARFSMPDAPAASSAPGQPSPATAPDAPPSPSPDAPLPVPAPEPTPPGLDPVGAPDPIPPPSPLAPEPATPAPARGLTQLIAHLAPKAPPKDERAPVALMPALDGALAEGPTEAPAGPPAEPPGIDGDGILRMPAGGLPRLTAVPGAGTVALQSDAPMSFLSIQRADHDGASAVPDMLIAKTEVTQAQWAALMALDMSSISGHWDHPAEAMSWCEALRYANLLSRKEGLRPPYEVPKDCEYGAEVRWDRQASGYRLLTEMEWLGLQASAGAVSVNGASSPDVARVNNRGVHSVGAAATSQDLGVVGLPDNVREWIWGGETWDAPPGDGKTELHQPRRPRSVVRGCVPVDPGDAAAVDAARKARLVTGEPTCRAALPAATVPLGVGLRLAKGPPAS